MRSRILTTIIILSCASVATLFTPPFLYAEVSSPGEDVGDAVIGFDYHPCGTQTSASEDTNAIRLTRKSSNQAISRHDVDGIVSFLDEEYVITISSGAIMYGREKQAASKAPIKLIS